MKLQTATDALNECALLLEEEIRKIKRTDTILSERETRENKKIAEILEYVLNKVKGLKNDC